MPTQLKVANRSIFVAEGSPARVGTKWSEREKGGDHAPGDSKGHSPWRAFGDFPRVGKVTRGGGAERPPLGGCGGERPPLGGAQRGLRPLASSGSEGRSALHLRDCAPRIKTKTILDSSASLRYTGKKENRRNHHVRKKTGPQRSLLVRQPEKI